MVPQSLHGRTALVTGSVQGIGLAIACKLAGAGARIAVHGLASEEQAAEAVAGVLAAGAPEARFFPGELRSAEAIATLVDACENWGPLDILVNNAGIQRVASLETVTREIWDSIIAINLTAPFETMRRALPNMARRGYGRVVNIASAHGLVASVDKAPYVASKFGLVGLSRVAALEYAAAGSRETGGVTVNCICPGFTETPIIEPQIAARSALLNGASREDSIRSLLSEKQPTGRLSQVEEIAEMVLFLTGRTAHNMTGTALPIDGGWTAH
ncbi:MAG: 3-hydroxybutyrate dehydrogenase [Rhizobiaceae bacterium]